MSIEKAAKFWGIIALVAAIGFSMAGCENPTGSTHAHQWGAWRQTRAPTCTTAGEETRTCTIDPKHIETQTIPIDPAAHDWGEWAGTVTCTTAGTGTRVCALNKEHTETKNLPALGHNYEWTVITVPTCTTAGLETGTCTHDSSHTTIRAIAIDPNAHDYQNWTQIAASTCTTAGLETGTCTRDAATTTRSIAINPNAHNWNSEKEIIPATITDDGKKAITCKYNRAHTKDEESTGEYATGTPGLEFDLFAVANSGNPDVIVYGSYSVRKGTLTSGAVHIPAYHRPDANSQYWPVTEIGDYDDDDDFNGAFENTNITAVTFAKNSQLEYINVNAFKNCTRLTSIEIPADVREIYSGTFSGCTSLTNVTFAAGSQLEIIGVRRYEEGIYDPSDIIGAFSGCSSLTSITIPVGVTIIDWRAFENCTSLTNVTFAAGSQLEYIGGYAFFGCISLANITIPASVTTIDNYAFDSCTSLTAITIPAGVTSIGWGAFDGCTGITSITIPVSVTAVDGWAFAGWQNTQTIYVAGYANQAAADAAWDVYDWQIWRGACNAVIKYWNGTTWV